MSAMEVHRSSFRVLMLAGVLALAGCASMSPEECLKADWHQKGVQDGRSGKARHYMDEHAKACREVGVTPDTQQYMVGREEGLRQYCTPSSGFEEGRRGHSYAQVCPADLEPGFLARFRDGRRVYDAQQRVYTASSRVNDKERAVFMAHDDKDKARLRRELGDLQRDLQRARDDLASAERRYKY